MQFAKKLTKIFALILAVLCTALFTYSIYIYHKTPDCYTVVNDGDFCLELPLKVRCKSDKIQQVSATGEACSAELTVLGIVPIKDVWLVSAESKYVTLCGTPFGIKLYTDGVMVVGLSDVTTASGGTCPARDAGIEKGDMIISVDGEKVYSNAEIALAVADAGGRAVRVEYSRGGQKKTAEITPARSGADSTYKLGMWVRDSSAGIGPLTFYNSATHTAAGLGHGICDADTGMLVPVREGEMVTATVVGVKKGAAGSPGELCGVMSYIGTIGKVESNSDMGIYAKTSAHLSGDTVRVAMRQEVHTGAAKILTTVDGNTPRYYDCEITGVDYSDGNLTKNLLIKVTDQELLNITGGIVQGMSGSPLIQNGKLIGAVTHVLVNAPTKGYGIFAENMLETAQIVAEEKLKEAS